MEPTPRNENGVGEASIDGMATLSKWPRRLKRTAVAGAILVGLPWGFLELQPFRHDAISFEVAPGCGTGEHGLGSAPVEDSFVQKWEKGELVISASERSYCDQVDSVSAQVVAGHLFLRLKYGKPGGPPAACLCRHNTVVRLKGVEDRTYFIHRVGFARIGG